MRKASIKVEISFHDGAYRMANEINHLIDALILESNHYRENEKLWKLRDRTVSLEKKALRELNASKEKLDKAERKKVADNNAPMRNLDRGVTVTNIERK